MEKSEAKKLISEVKAILNEWDFIGVMPGEGGPDDEYDCLHGELIHLIQANADRGKIRSYLITELKDHFGLSQANYSQSGLEQVIERLVALENN